MSQPGILQLAELSAQVRAHLHGHILPFWCGPALDREQGGWMAWLANDLSPDRTQPKGLVVNARLLWTFSAVCQRAPGPLYREMAQRARAVVMDQFWDQVHGGGFWRLDDAGKVIDDSKKIYGQAFCIYALAEFHRAFADNDALRRARELFELIEAHAHDPRHGGYFEVCSRDWSPAGPDARLSEKDMSEKKSMNNQLHVLEAYSSLYRVWREPRVARRLGELIALFELQIVDPATAHLHHFFDEQWNVRSDTYTFGHDIEASWLLCEAAQTLDDAAVLGRVRALALRMAQAVLTEAVDLDGGLHYEGKGGRIMDPGKECWPQAEALVGFLNAFQLSGDARFLQGALGAWNFIRTRLADPVHGEWFWRINPNGEPDAKLPKVSEWKGPYHGSRACLEALHRLASIAASSPVNQALSQSPIP